MATITAVSAGAGSGKTHDLAEHIASRVVAGQDPAKILATTFTRKAATELRARIEARILAEPGLPSTERVAKAKRLEHAPIGTVHSVGFQLLQKYALRLGLSPELQVLEEGASERLTREFRNRLVFGADPGLQEACRRLGVENPGEVALQLLQLMRGNRIGGADFRRQLTASLDELSALIARDSTVEGNPFETLADLAREAIAKIGRTGDATKATKDAVNRLHAFASRPCTWGDFLAAAKIKAAKASDGFLSDVRAFAAQVRQFQNLHRDLRTYVSALVDLTLQLEEGYTDYKKQRGLLDFTDLETEFLRVLETPGLRESLRQDVELLAVDEFQDTNPLQLAIFQALRNIAAESRWVGDPKQAIYGFRGADADLMGRVWNTIPEDRRRRLGKNYRSQAGLVSFFNRLFEPVFGPESALENHHPAEPRGIERWLLDTRNKEEDSSALSVGVAQLLSEGFQPGDIAILARTHKDALSAAEALKELEIPCVTKIPGLFDTRECALVLAGLRVAADRLDSLAAATIVHILEEKRSGTPDWIVERLRAARENRARAENQGESGASRPAAPWADNAVLNALQELNVPMSPPCATLYRVIEVLGLAGLLGKWNQPSQRGGRLDNLIAFGAQYEEEAVELGLAATLTGMIAWFEKLWRDGEDKISDPEGIQAVTAMTYHAAKGLEWPVVVLTGLDFGRDPDLWTPRVSGGNVDEGEPLKDRLMRYWPWPFGRNLFSNKVLTGSNLETDALQTEVGKHIAGIEAEEARRLLYVGMTRACRKLVLAHRPGKCEWLQMFPEVEILAPAASPGEYDLQGIGTSLVVRSLSADMTEDHRQPVPEKQLWLAAPTVEPRPAVERFHNPSRQEPVADPVEVFVEELPGPHPFPAVKTEQYEMLGNAVHAYLAALPSFAAAPEDRKVEIALNCLKAWEAEGLVTPQALVAAGARLEAWVRLKGGVSLLTEVPVTSPRSGGGQWVGAIDLVIEVGNEQVLLVDHKSRPIPPGMAAGACREFSGQLAAYCEILNRNGLSVASSWIHFPLAGVMVQVE